MRAFVIVVLLVLCFAVGTCVGRSGPLQPAGAQGEWSHGRAIADPAIVMAVVSAPIHPDGSVGPERRQDAYIGATAPDRVADWVVEPGRSYVHSCTFDYEEPVEYPSTLFLPILGGRYRSRR